MMKVPSKEGKENTTCGLPSFLSNHGIAWSLSSQREIPAPLGIFSILFRSEYDEFFSKLGHPVDFPSCNHPKFEQMSQCGSPTMPAQAIASSAGWQTVADLHSTSLGSLHDMINLPRPIYSFTAVTTSPKINRVTAKVAMTTCLFPDRAELCLSHTLVVVGTPRMFGRPLNGE
jgi:hypothetical protein